MKNTVLRCARFVSKTSLPETAFIASFILGRYLVNADFQYISETIIPIIFFGLIAAAAFYLYRAVLGSWLAARVATLSFVYSLYSFSFLPTWLRSIGNPLLPKSAETAFTSATLAAVFISVICGLLGYGAVRLNHQVSFIRNLQLHRIILFVLLFIFGVQVLKTANKLVTFRNELSYTYPAPMYAQNPNANVTKPDIYYFVFDRYGNTPALKDNFNFDNSDLTSYLANQGFVNNKEAYSNYPFTMSSITSTMAMEYHTGLSKLFSKDKLQTAFPYRSIFNNPPIAQVLRQNGYTYNQLSSWWDFTRVGINAEGHPTESFRLRAFGKNFYLSDLSRDIVNKSILKPWLKKGVTAGSTMLLKYDNDDNPRENFYAQKAAILTLAGTSHTTPQFTFAHVLAPHPPYIFMADGSSTTYDDGNNDYGVDETLKYTNTVTYLNTQIKEMMSYIREKSPNAVVVIQSDEGPYPKQFRFELTPKHYYDPADLSLELEKQKYGILASYYMPGVDEATVRKNITTSVNPFRFILKHYLGYDIDMLPVCNFSTGDKFTIYSFKNETPKLQTNPSAACDSL